MALKNNTWKLNQWYDQNVAGNVSYSGVPILYAVGGDNNYGQLGLNDKVLRSSPTQVPGTTWDGDNIRYVGDHAVLRKTDGTLWSVGSASWGTLGLNDESTDQSSPTQIPGTTWSSVASIDAGQISAATKTDGTLWVWGQNNYGVIGQNQAYSGPAKGRSSPTQIPGTTWSHGGSGNYQR